MLKPMPIFLNVISVLRVKSVFFSRLSVQTCCQIYKDFVSSAVCCDCYWLLNKFRHGCLFRSKQPPTTLNSFFQIPRGEQQTRVGHKENANYWSTRWTIINGFWYLYKYKKVDAEYMKQTNNNEDLALNYYSTL